MAKKISQPIRHTTLARVVACVVLIWLTMNVVVANWTARPVLPDKDNEHFELELKLKKAIARPEPMVEIQKIRARLILDYVNKQQLVKARRALIVYKNWLDTNPDFLLMDKIEMHSQLALMHMALNEIEPAVKQYDIIIQALEPETGFDADVARARYLNDRAVGNYLYAQTFEDEDLRRDCLTDSMRDFRDCRELVGQLKAFPGAQAGNTSSTVIALGRILNDNQSFFETEMLFTPEKERP